MGKILVIVESPGKIDKLQKILGNNYTVIASVGHIIDLDPKKMSIEIENDFKPNYKVLEGKENVIEKIKTCYKVSSDILLATDKDREGEMIAWSIAYILDLKNPKRIVFGSITEKEILEAVKSTKNIDDNLVDAQKTRRILDRIVGYEISPLLMKSIGPNKLSAGRVQSVVVKLIIERENEIKEFLSKGDISFFKFKGYFIKDNKSLISTLYKLENKDNNGILKGNIAKIDTIENSRNFLKKCVNSKFIVKNIFDKKSVRSPAPPFTTSTLQQEAGRKLGMQVSVTMRSAQILYEEGYITYMRTDSVNLSEEALQNIKKYVTKTYGTKYYRLVNYKSKSQNTQEAHEAVRPTDVFVENLDDKNGKIGINEKRLYNLIWKRTVASQMQPAEYNITTIQIEINKVEEYYFTTEIETIVFLGYLRVYNMINVVEDENESNDNINKDINIPKVGEELKLEKIEGKQEYLKPPVRYNQISLVNQLDPERLNIGRPATYASIIQKIQDRGYVKIQDITGIEKNIITIKYDTNNITEEEGKIIIGNEQNKFVPSSLGLIVTDFLQSNFPKIMDYEFTATMETSLDEIASGNMNWVNVLKTFYDDFHPLVVSLYKTKPVIADKYTRILGKDPKTGSDIIATISRYSAVVKKNITKTKFAYAPIKEPLTLETITLEDALKLFEYPKVLGKYKDKDILLNKGKFGLYVSWNTIKASLGDITNEDDIDLEKVKELIDKKAPLNVLKDDSKTYTILEGPYGKYIKVEDKKTKKSYNVSLGENNEKELTIEKVKTIIDTYFKSKQSKRFVKKPNYTPKTEGGNKTIYKSKTIYKKKSPKK